MNAKLDKALNRLKRILPLQQRQQACTREIRALHQRILRSFVDRGRILTSEEMAQQVGDPEHAISVLKSADLVVFSGDGEPVGAYPFTMEVRAYEVRVNRQRVYAMCALDALAISPMFGMKTQIASRCRITGGRIAIRQSGTAIENPDVAGELHFGIDWGAADAGYSCANSLCMQMMFLQDAHVARQWLEDDAGNREIFTLPEAVEFARRFFVPLMS